MIGIDKNILARAYLEDDKTQSEEAQKFLLQHTKDNTLFISSYAILEFAWILKVKKFTRKEIYEAIMDLIDSAGVVVSGSEIISEALIKYINGKADLADYMILADGMKHKASSLKTFDKVFEKEL